MSAHKANKENKLLKKEMPELKEYILDLEEENCR